MSDVNKILPRTPKNIAFFSFSETWDVKTMRKTKLEKIRALLYVVESQDFQLEAFMANIFKDMGLQTSLDVLFVKNGVFRQNLKVIY